MFSIQLLICKKQKGTDCWKLLIFRHLTLIVSSYHMPARNKIIVKDMFLTDKSVLLNHSVKLSQ